VLAFVQVAAPAVVAAMLVLFIIIVIGTYMFVYRPLLDWLTRRGPGWLGGLIRWVTRPLESRVKNFVKEHLAALSRLVLANQPALLLMLDQMAELTQRIAGTLGDMAEQTWRALWTLRHVTVPNLIAAALVPVKAQLARHTERLDAVEDLNRRVAVVVGTGLRSLPWGAPGTYVGNFEQWWNSYRHLWAQTFEHIVPRLDRIQFDLLPKIGIRLDRLTEDVTRIREEALPAIRQRLGRIEDALGDLLTSPTTWFLTTLGLTLTPILAPSAVRAGLDSLFCRNTRDVTRNLCRMDEALLAQLLAGTLVFALALDPRVIARAGQTLYGGAEAVFRETALR